MIDFNFCAYVYLYLYVYVHTNTVPLLATGGVSSPQAGASKQLSQF